MVTRDRISEENERRAKIRELLQTSGISSMDDIQDLFKETIAEFMENGLETELDDELGYNRCDYKNKDTDNSRNGHSRKILRTCFGDLDVFVSREHKGKFSNKAVFIAGGIDLDGRKDVLDMQRGHPSLDRMTSWFSLVYALPERLT